MIFAYRKSLHRLFRGFNVAIIKDWIQPIEQLPALAFKAFDETLIKLHSDHDATRILPVGASQSPMSRLSELHTAEEAARQALPERYRDALSFFSMSLEKQPNIRIISSFPNWAHLWAEDQSGQTFKWERNSQQRGWMEWPLELNDHRIHLSFFTDALELNLNDEKLSGTHRLSDLIDQTRQFKQGLSLSLPIHKEEWML